MNIYRVTRTDSWGWDEYDSFVCYAENKENAKDLHPSGRTAAWDYRYGDWVRKDEKENLKVELLGEAQHVTESGIILASYSAG